MDYAMDYYFGSDADADTIAIADADHSNEYQLYFIYDDYRFFSKLYVLFKTFGLFCYAVTFSMCESRELYILITGMMFLSTANSARYEYRHYQRYNTTFYSIHEYHAWKDALWPKSRAVFSFTELSIKIGYFIYMFPPQFDFMTSCDVGKGLLMIHILILFFLYILSGVFSGWLLCYVSCWRRGTGARAVRAAARSTTPTPTPTPRVAALPMLMNRNPNEECCICLDNAVELPWVLLPCGHMFHISCITQWLITRETCPVCRVRVRLWDE